MNPLSLLNRLHITHVRLGDRRKRLFRVAYSWCQDRAVADDLVQETMTRAWKNMASLRKPGSLDSWLFNILANCWRDHLRRERKIENLDDEAILSDLVKECDIERQDLIARVRHAVKELPRTHREVIALVDLEGFSYKEVSQMLDIPQGTVTSRITRARETLRHRLRDIHVPDQETPIVRLRRVK